MESRLDGVTLLRYAHIYRNRSSGGAEQYLRQVNAGLLSRYQMTILQTHLVTAGSRSFANEVEIEKCGQGQIVWVPVGIYEEDCSVRSCFRRFRILQHSRGTASDSYVSHTLSVIRTMFANSCGHFRYPSMILSENLVDLFNVYKVDLVILHWLSYDIGSLIASAVNRHTPFGIVNHFDNRRLSMAPPKWIRGAAAIGGVSSRNVPRQIRHNYVNLSDAVDVDFFSPSKAMPVLGAPEGFIVLLVSRIAAGKGHEDLLAAVRSCREVGVMPSIVFIGAVESESLLEELQKRVSLWGLRDKFLLLGQLTQEKLRDWYARSDLVVLPSEWEGLGRVLLEAQAMEKPVVTYDSGGTVDALVADKTGFIVRAGDCTALAGRIKYLIDNPGRRSEMGKLGRTFVKDHFSVHALIDRHERFYTDAIDQAS